MNYYYNFNVRDFADKHPGDSDSKGDETTEGVSRVGEDPGIVDNEEKRSHDETTQGEAVGKGRNYQEYNRDWECVCVYVWGNCLQKFIFTKLLSASVPLPKWEQFRDNSEAVGRKDSEELSAATRAKNRGDRIAAAKEEPEEDVTLADEDTAK